MERRSGLAGSIAGFAPGVMALAIVFVLALHVPGSIEQAKPQSRKPLLVAHRGASAYAPEHTLAAYRLAIEQGADFVEQDLQITKDGRLVCLHDADLARTTNVSIVFPDRARDLDADGDGKATRGWYTVDFTLAEIKQLDAGSWFNRANSFAAREAYSKEKVPTLEEAADAIAGRAGLYIELKHYEFYKSLGLDMPQKLAAVLRNKSFANKPDRVLIQSFYKTGLLRMREVAPVYPRIQLLPMEDAGREDSRTISGDLAREIASYARGAGPAKQLLRSAADVKVLHDEGLLVHPYTFRGSTSAAARRPLDEVQQNGASFRANVVTEIRKFLELGIDGGFTDYPDLWKEAANGAR